MAVEQETQGKVFVSFVVEKDGTVSNVTVVKGIGGGCDEEAIRVIKKSPRWRPGMQHNLPVRVRYNMPLSFTLSK
jgi:protein TonB